MKLAIMQPYFLPYIGYFQLINSVDKWIIYDTVQYINHGWINRNRMIHPEVEKVFQYITIPIKKHSLNTAIKDIEINNNEKWKQKILGQLNHYKKKAEFFTQGSNLISECLNIEENNISKFNALVLDIICKKLDINFNYLFSSELERDFSYIDDAEERVISICNYLEASEYINLIGGIELYNSDRFALNDIKLGFLKTNNFQYKQFDREYIPFLSILDIFMFNSIEKIKDYINDYQIIENILI